MYTKYIAPLVLFFAVLATFSFVFISDYDAKPKYGASTTADCYWKAKRKQYLCESYTSNGYYSNYFTSCQIRTTVMLSQGLKSDISARVVSCN